MKFKFNDRAKVIGNGFYSGQVGTIVGYGNFGQEIYNILLPYNITVSLDAIMLEKIVSTKCTQCEKPLLNEQGAISE